MKRALFAAAAVLATSASLAAGAVGRMVDVSVFDRTSGRELPVYWHDGRPYVVGKPGNEYKITLRNRRGEDLLAVVSVDGVNVVSGRTASPDQGGYVLEPWQRTDIKGWRKNLGETASFYFTSLGDSYAGRTGRPDNVGVIGVALFERAYHHYDEPEYIDPYRPYGPRSKEGAAPADKSAESGPRAKSHTPGAPLGTGHGRREHSRARLTDFERASPYPAETIAIYYDSYPNLVAMGVIPDRRYGRRDPDPFPQRFVPDPPRYWY